MGPCADNCITLLTSSGAPVYNDPIRCLSDCPVTIIPNTNTITSPNHPENYPDNAYIYYAMTAPAGQTIEITFNEFELENWERCRYDWVVIVDGDGTELHPKTCGSQIPGKIESKTNIAILVFF